MKKADRQLVFEKYNGHCAYCGCNLEKGWHVDHAEPVQRKKKHVGSQYVHNDTGVIATPEDVEKEDFWQNFKYKPGRYVDDGFHFPENDVFENYMPSCPSCNINKHGANIEQFRGSIQRLLDSLNLYSTNYKFAKKYGLVEETNQPVVFYFEKIHQEQKVA